MTATAHGDIGFIGLGKMDAPIAEGLGDQDMTRPLTLIASWPGVPAAALAGPPPG